MENEIEARQGWRPTVGYGPIMHTLEGQRGVGPI